MAKKDDEIFESSTKCWIYNNSLVKSDVKVKDIWYITGKYRGAGHRDCNIKVSLNYKIPIVLHNLKNKIHILLCKSLAN